jgi:hypothetical protein
MTDIVYIGFDPGAVTGIAWTSLDERKDVLTGCAPPDAMKACDTLYQIVSWYMHLEDDPPIRIIVSGEAYTMGSSVRTHQPDALYILGALRWMIHKFFPSVEFRITGAAEASHVGNITTLKAAGWWIPGDPDQHRNRAAAQVAHAMMMTEPRRWYDLINPSDQGDISDGKTTAYDRRTQVSTFEDSLGQGPA